MLASSGSAGTDLPTLIAIVTAVAGSAAGLATVAVTLLTARQTKSKIGAEAENQQALADNTRAGTPFQGGAYVKELSEAASSLVTPLRSENEKLHQRIQVLEARMDELEEKEQDARRQLHHEREVNSSAKESFDNKLRALTVAYQEQIDALKQEVTELEAQIERSRGPDRRAESP